MNNNFDKEILWMEQELLDLKTATQKSAMALDIFSHSISVSIPLSLNQYQTTATGRAVYILGSASDIVMWSYLDWYYGNVNDAWKVPRTTRSISVQNCFISGDMYIVLRAYGDANDVQTLKNGGSVNITNTLTVRATGEFTLEEYNE